MTLSSAHGQPILTPTGDVSDLLSLASALQDEATKFGIHNVFDDGGYKEMFMLKLFGLKKLNREGDDAEDAAGRRYEMKTVARVSSAGERKKSLSVTTEHTLTIANINRYRNVFLWIVGVFDQSDVEAIYEIKPDELEFYFANWEQRITAQGPPVPGEAPRHLNNPKIPLRHITQHGVQVWPVRAPLQSKLALP